MANTFITNTSKFKPFSFQEMLQPYAIYTDAYNKTEEELVNLDIMANDVASKLNNPLDEELKKQYQGFQDELNTAMNDLYDKGLTPGTKKKLAGLKAKYTQNLNPINEAYKAYQEDQKQLVNLKRAHPEMIIEGIGASVSDYMYGNTPSGLTANTDDIYNKSLKEAAGTSSRFSEILKPTGILGNQYYQFKTQQGISQDMVEQLRNIVDNPYSKEAVKYLNTEEGKALYDIVTEQRRANNYSSFSKEAQDRIDASILNGIFAGASFKEDVDRVSNKNWKETPPPPVDTNTNLFFRSIPRVVVDENGVSTTRANESIKFLQQVLDNPDILNVRETTTAIEPALKEYYPHVRGKSEYIYPNLQKFSNIAKTYGLDIDVNNIESLNAGIQALQSKISEAAQVENDFVLSVTDDKLIKNVVSQNTSSYEMRTGNTGIREIVNGRVKNKEIENVAEFFDGNVHLTYSPGLGIVITSTKNNKTKSAVVDPYLIDGSGMVNSFVNSIESNIENGNYEVAKMLIQGSDSYTGLMEFLYNTFNTIPMVQGTSTTNPINP